MADEFNQTGVCSGNWWNSDRIINGSSSSSLPFSTPPNDVAGINYGLWGNSTTTTTNTIDHHHQISTPEMIKTRSSDDSASVSCSSSIVFQDTQKPQESDSLCEGSGGGGTNSILMDSTLQMMGFALSSSSPSLDWNNQNYLSNHKYRSSNGRTNDDHDQAVTLEDWNNLKSFSQHSNGEDSSSTITSFKQINQGFVLDQQQQQQQHTLNSAVDDSNECTVVMDSSSSLYGCPSRLLQGLFEPAAHDHNLQPQPTSSYYDNNQVIDHFNPSYLTNNYFIVNSSSSNINDHLSSSTTSQKFPPHPHHHQLLSNNDTSSNQPLHFSNYNVPCASATLPAAIMTNCRSSFFPSSQKIQLHQNYKPNSRNHTVKTKQQAEEVRDSNSIVKRSNNEPSFKRPRIETPSQLPTFKVRKEKLGDRITALQQLVSPFGKTDTASVLFEAIEYIKFLHDQVSVLSAPYLKNGAQIQHHHHHRSQNSNKTKENLHTQDLRSRGLCLVPISSTFPVTNETATDFWTPTFGGTYR